MELQDLYGEHILTGVAFGDYEITEGDKCNTVDFILDGKVYSAIEDYNDGYRSSMKEIMEGRICEIQNTFPPLIVIGKEMLDTEYKKNDGLDFIDKITGKIVLSIGTENIDDYYPAFVQRFHPENMAHNIVN